MNDDALDYLDGWNDAEEAIENKLPGYQDFSQGDKEWDKGWNARLELEQESKS